MPVVRFRKDAITVGLNIYPIFEMDKQCIMERAEEVQLDYMQQVDLRDPAEVQASREIYYETVAKEVQGSYYTHREIWNLCMQDCNAAEDYGIIQPGIRLYRPRR